MRKLLLNYLGVSLLLFCGPCFNVAIAQNHDGSIAPVVAPRELLVIKPAIDGVWGTWIAAVIHRGTTPQELSFFVNLPREAADFQPAEGLEAKDLKLEQDGILVRKVFAPGVNVISLLFMVPASYGSTSMTFLSRRDLPEMTVMTPKGLLAITSDRLVSQEDDRQDGQHYAVLGLSKPLATGQELTLNISGVPEGRGRLWVMGGIASALLLIASIGLVLRTRPKVAADQPEGVLT